MIFMLDLIRTGCNKKGHNTLAEYFMKTKH